MPRWPMTRDTDLAWSHPRVDSLGRWTDPSPAPRLVVLSGAGLSVESGLSLYRAAEGLWENHDVNQVCNIRTWKAHAALVHAFYDDRRADSLRATPNAGHQLMVDLETAGAVLVTQNVDLLMEGAGAQHVLHLHGRIDAMQCTACGHEWSVSLTTRWNPEVDRCPHCDSRRGVKPGVVFFGERAPNYMVWRRLMAGLRAQDVVLMVGSSGEVINVLDHPGSHQRWLANLAPHPRLPEAAFRQHWYAPITQSAPAILEAWETHASEVPWG
jgi:NAD-dependent deacetylase